jgi:1-acyl-sn-glycerol-3-phosphate acyltransferase
MTDPDDQLVAVARDRPAPRSRPTGRDRLVRVLVRFLVHAWVRPRVEGVESLPPGPAVLCFNHQSWADPFVMESCLPAEPVLFFFGPREADMTVGWRNRLIDWTRRGVPYRPAKDDLLTVTRRVERVLAAGARMAIAPEGRIHIGESALLPLEEGAVFLALRGRVPLVPVAINGMGWLRFGGRVRLRVGEPIVVTGRPTRQAVAEATERLASALLALTADWPDSPPPGRFGRWLTEVFNDWPEGARPPLPPRTGPG